jgi:hypothetical protein
VHVAGALAAHLLYPVEQRLLDDWLVQAFDRLGGVPSPGDVPGVGGVAEHLPNGVHAERPAAGGALIVDVQPRGEGAVGVLAGGVHLEQPADVRGLLGVGGGDLIRALDVSPG